MVASPLFYRPERVGTLFYPDAEAIAASAEDAGLPPASEDTTRTALLLVDMQVDFCHAEGALHVPGAEDDLRRTIAWIYAHAERITHIVCSLDTHYPLHIFHAAWWKDRDGNRPDPLTAITVEDVENGNWVPDREAEWSRAYVRKLKEEARKDLVIWPYHVPIGGFGNALDPELWSAVFWHSIARRTQPTFWVKGTLPRTEHYSVLGPEVPPEGEDVARYNRDFIELLDAYGTVVLAGEAESHCVLETLNDLVKVLGDDRETLSRLVVLKDCMSPVRHPDVDFHALALERFKTHAQTGVRFIDSTAFRP